MIKLKFKLDEKIKGLLVALSAFWFHAQKLTQEGQMFFKDEVNYKKHVHCVYGGKS